MKTFFNFFSQIRNTSVNVFPISIENGKNPNSFEDSKKVCFDEKKN